MIADMGFSAAQARKALRETVSQATKRGPRYRWTRLIDQNGNPERAIEWLFNNPGDEGEEEAAPAPAPGSISTPDIGGTSTLPANYRLKAFISHKGPSVHSGHYVATIRQPQRGLATESEDEWVLYNDEKVARAPPHGGEEMRSLAYLYVYERV
jgi:ubiquitin carboxyl-terminal hydrolase 5/13